MQTPHELITAALNDQGYEVICADNPEQAIALAHTNHFDFFLVDSWLPDASVAGLHQEIEEIRLLRRQSCFIQLLPSTLTKERLAWRGSTVSSQAGSE